MDAGTLVTVTNQWLARFEAALASGDVARLQSLFHPDSHWRDVLALTAARTARADAKVVLCSV